MLGKSMSGLMCIFSLGLPGAPQVRQGGSRPLASYEETDVEGDTSLENSTAETRNSEPLFLYTSQHWFSNLLKP